MDISKITEAELEVLKVIWKHDKVLSSEIVDNLVKITQWKPKTIQTLLKRLVTKNAVSSEKINEKTYIYYANITEDEYKANANKSFLKKLYDGSLSLMVSTFIKDDSLSDEEMEELKRLLDGEG